MLREAAPAVATALRSFASGTYLDKAQVTDRVMAVVKNFSKVDPAKARRAPLRHAAQPRQTRRTGALRPATLGRPFAGR